MSSLEPSQEQILWKHWMTSQDNEAANLLIENYMYLVSFHTERIVSQLPNRVDREEIRSYGLLGLYDALHKFELKRDLKFDTYASFRIKGSIMDGLRKEDWLPRSIREKTKKVEQASEIFEQKNQREAQPEDIAEMTGMPIQDVEITLRDMVLSNMLSIEDKPKGQENDLKEGIGYNVSDKPELRPEERLIQEEWKDELIEGIKSLNEKEQLVISLFYQEELTFTEIGQVLELTTSRISQIHKRSIVKLRSTLQKITQV
ncbi:RNA polymerase sigma-D factor [Oceanobacillus oncorhynchi subsp. incaldanensis]|uniref:FliA/WhiG family RNA polymerase sigma factor n=1 Tax=Oceanobacillus aidingensis TaxID=645964 RepID=A0ABV9K4B0_9BACI|nr:FliA/WhiG family RNA polymerase sigma factor [Oceanobacillus oncorhynchi]MDM8099283.1 FliA/WhiG family RNA polymerase sigma factor [Oceanobacillus oncorhynchi]UUI38586.1 FliA/WhiG family RNA polymerase sigma factor [Oceanobacillus oncorhynchi]GIO18403.1 RNA polymerase sigma-D factor [Oceanobacillus oncorhynchi subsp. incaldanensis]